MPRELNAGLVREIRKRGSTGTETLEQIALDYDVSNVQVSRIIRRLSWGWVPDDPKEIPDHADDPHWVYGETKAFKKERLKRKLEAIRQEAKKPLSEEIWRALKQIKDGRFPDALVREIRRLAAKEWPATIIAQRFNLHYNTVYSIAAGRTYLHVS